MTQTVEERIGDLVASVDQQTTAVENLAGSIDQQMTAALADFELWRNDRDVIGDLTGYGTVRKAIFQGFVHNTDENLYTPSGQGDFAGKVASLGTRSLVYFHFKTPMNINVDADMFRFDIKGYSYGSSAIIDEVIVGYCYNATPSLINKASFGGLNPDSYVDSAGNVILRILMPNAYYTTLKIDAMRVGNGRLFNNGDLDVKLSLASTVEF
jgi:hypothetical protein